jgi:hypothetical protein
MCLTQAIAAGIMLKQRRIAYNIYLGVARNNNNQLIAHAWLRSGDILVTGGDHCNQFTVTGILSYTPKIEN